MNLPLARDVVKLWDQKNYYGSLNLMLTGMLEQKAIAGFQMSFQSSNLVVRFGEETPLAKVYHTDPNKQEIVTFGDQRKVVEYARTILRFSKESGV